MSDVIQRYDITHYISYDDRGYPCSDWEKRRDAGGVFVLAEDHDRVVAELTAKIESLRIVYVTSSTGDSGAHCPVTIT